MDRFLLSSLWGTPVFRRAVTAKGGKTGLPANGEEVSFTGTIEGDGGKLSSSYPSPGSANSDRGFAPCGTRRSVRRRYALDENERTTAGNPKPRGSPFLSGEGGLFGRISFVLQREHGISFAVTFRNPFTFLGIPSLKTGGISFRAIMSSHLTRVYSIYYLLRQGLPRKFSPLMRAPAFWRSLSKPALPRGDFAAARRRSPCEEMAPPRVSLGMSRREILGVDSNGEIQQIERDGCGTFTRGARSGFCPCCALPFLCPGYDV